MAQKEFYAGMLAYSLIRIVMWKAGERLEGGIKLISFSQARRWLQHSLKNWGSGLHTSSKDMTRWIKALLQVTIDLALPKRKKPRPSEIRRIRRRSAKFSAFSGSRAAARARYLKPKTL